MRSFTVEEISTFLSPSRRHIVRLYDPTVDSISDVVLGNDTSGIDVSNRVIGGNRTESINEVVFQSVTLRMVDKDGSLHPDFGANKRYVYDRAIMRVSVIDDNWTGGERHLFTGFVTGTPGYVDGREGHVLTLTAQDRMSRFQKRRMTSIAYPLGTDYGAIARNIGLDLMGLQSDEILIPAVLSGLVPVAGAGLTGHDPVQFVDVPPAEMLRDVLWPVFLVPKFTGDGRLFYAFWDVLHSTDVVFEDGRSVGAIAHQHNPNLALPSLIRLIGLDSQMSQTIQPRQKLVDLEVTIGWWDKTFERRIDFSEDGTQRAEDAELVVAQSVKAGIIPIPGDEEFTQDDEFGGTLVVDTPYNPLILALVIAAYVSSAALGDFHAGLAGITIPVGRIAQGAAQMLVQQTILQIQRAIYEIHARPFEYIFREIEDNACLESVPNAEHVEWVRKAHLVTSHDWIKELLTRLVSWFLKQQSMRQIPIADWRLEAGDRFSVPGIGKHFITQINEPFGRQAPGLPTATCMRVGAE